MAGLKRGHSSEKGKPLSERLPVSSSLPDAQHIDDIARGDLDKVECSYRQYLDHPIEREYGGVGSKIHEDRADDLSQPSVSRRLRSNHAGFPKQYQESARKILQVLTTATPPSPDFYWVPDIEHFTLFYREKDTGLVIYVRGDTGEFDVTINHGRRGHHLLSVPTLRQAQAICHTIVWAFRDRLPTNKVSTQIGS
jgi:hypothetical protein